MALDPSGNVWYSLTNFFVAKIIHMNGNGNDQVIHTFDIGTLIGNISFDLQGGMYVSGGAEAGNFIPAFFVTIFECFATNNYFDFYLDLAKTTSEKQSYRKQQRISVVVCYTISLMVFLNPAIEANKNGQ